MEYQKGIMSKSVNKVFLLGNVTRDPEIRDTKSGTIVANLSLATNDRQKDAQGEWKDVPEYHNLVAFKRTAEIIRDYVHKGSKLYIEGKLQTQSWEKDGVKHYKTVIFVNDLGLLDGKTDANAAANGYPQGRTVYQKPAAQEEMSDDAIPF